ncbi:MAG TPA: TauD/TfdA family dioxygenase [Pyrinomonadaceae bacterium]
MSDFELKIDGPGGFRHRRKALGATSGELITESPLGAGDAFGLLMQPAAPNLKLAAWGGNNRETIDLRLQQHGAILFRNFALNSIEDFEQFTSAVTSEPVGYHDRTSPRSQVSGNVYTSTDHPADQPIHLHNENSYSYSWPTRIFFFCVNPADEGGQTPIADCRKVFRRISHGVRERFLRRGVMYVRNYGDGFGLTWQTVFQTTDRREVEAYCRATGIEYEWKDADRLRTRQVRPAAVKHPRTGEDVWFNQAALFHFTSLDSAVSDALLAEFAEADLPFNAYYGDGSPFAHAELEEVREAYRHETFMFDWQRGDLLMLDNMLAAHGRAPFAGARKIVVRMADSLNWTDLEAGGSRL